MEGRYGLVALLLAGGIVSSGFFYLKQRDNKRREEVSAILAEDYNAPEIKLVASSSHLALDFAQHLADSYYRKKASTGIYSLTFSASDDTGIASLYVERMEGIFETNLTGKDGEHYDDYIFSQEQPSSRESLQRSVRGDIAAKTYHPDKIGTVRVHAWDHADHETCRIVFFGKTNLIGGHLGDGVDDVIAPCSDELVDRLEKAKK